MKTQKLVCPIVLASDENYAMPLATTLRSIVESNCNHWPLSFHILNDGIASETRNKIATSIPKESATIRWIDLDLSLFGKFSTLKHVSKMTYSRFLIPQLFPTNADKKILYLDSDILVLDDLSQLCKIDLGECAVGAVLDRMDTLIKSNIPGHQNIPKVKNYFNAGILLIDLEQWRKNEISEKSLEYLKQNPDTPFSDQDALNFACDGLWKILDTRWNFHNTEEVRLSELAPKDRPAIAHFVTKNKPWKPNSFSLNASFYDSFRNRTKFSRSSYERIYEFIELKWFKLKYFLKQYRLIKKLLSIVKR